MSKNRELSMALFHHNCQRFDSDEALQEYAQSTAAMAIALLRGLAGNGYTNGFLLGALQDPKPLTIRPIRKH